MDLGERLDRLGLDDLGDRDVQKLPRPRNDWPLVSAHFRNDLRPLVPDFCRIAYLKVQIG